jgi:RNA polymerase sigma-70 factor (ECF subfamily)
VEEAGRDDERIRIEAAQRDPEAFAPLYETHFDQVYAYLARRVPDRAEVEDLTAEVFRKALAGIGGFHWSGAPFSAWLMRIAANCVADRARRALRAVAAEAPPDQEERTDREAAGRSDLFRLVADLPADQRRVIELRFAEERSIREIAAELGRSEGAVKQLQLRALRGLRRRMKRDDA